MAIEHPLRSHIRHLSVHDDVRDDKIDGAYEAMWDEMLAKRPPHASAEDIGRQIDAADRMVLAAKDNVEKAREQLFQACCHEATVTGHRDAIREWMRARLK